MDKTVSVFFFGGEGVKSLLNQRSCGTNKFGNTSIKTKLFNRFYDLRCASVLYLLFLKEKTTNILVVV